MKEEKKNTYVIVNRGSDVLLKQLPIPITLQQLLCCSYAVVPSFCSLAESFLMRHQATKVLMDLFVLVAQGTIHFSR